MPRARIPEQGLYPYHITARCINKEWFQIPIDEVWKIMSRELRFLTYAYEVEIYAFVLMNNHFHLIMRTPKANLAEAMWNFMRGTSRDLNFQANRINQTYGGRYSRSIISNQHYLRNTYKYVYANPIKAGIVKRAEDYKFSTLRGLMGFEFIEVPLVEDKILFESIESTLNWINKPVTEENWIAIRNALRKKEFKLAKSSLNNKPCRMEVDAL